MNNYDRMSIMNAKELLNSLRTKLELDSSISDDQVEMSVIGNSKEARANIMIETEGKIRILEVSVIDCGWLEAVRLPVFQMQQSIAE